MDNPAQGIVDQPVTADEMAAIDQAASQFGASMPQPTTDPAADNSTPTPDPAPAPSPFDQTPAEPAPDAQQAEPVLDETPMRITDDNPGTEPEAEITPEPSSSAPAADDSSSTTLTAAPAVETGEGTDEELLSVKQQALEELTPIVDTLELPAEERFDTLMMIIRASDDKKLVRPAYEAANQIADKDKKARALLDVVNEVNYLTQNNPDQA